MAENGKNPIALIILSITFVVFVVAILLSVSKNKLFPPALQTPEAGIEFAETVYDFGRVKDGETIEHTFAFRNTGQIELVIEKVSATCTCAAALISEKIIPPGGKGEIKASFNTEGYSGFASKNVHVTSNAPPVQLTIEGIIETPLSVVPGSVNLGKLRQGLEENRKFHIVKGGDENLRILKTGSSSEYISVKTKERPQNPPNRYRKSFEVEISVSPTIPAGLINEMITVFTNDKNFPKIEVPVIGDVKTDTELGISGVDSKIFVFPPLFLFGTAQQGKAQSQKINLQVTDNEPFKLLRIENPVEEFVSIIVNTKTEGKEYEIIATLNNAPPAGDTENFIIIHTDSHIQPQINIPLKISTE